MLLGSGELEESIQSIIRESNLTDAVQMEGFVQYEGLPHYFSGALCLILPSISDQWGLVVNEAMAAGLPVLVSDHCGCAHDLVRDKENGCIFDPHQAGSIAAAMIHLDARTQSEWGRMSEASKRIIANWDLEDFSEGLVRACRRAIDHPRKRGVRLLHVLLSR
jgi:glycosyltransferase involved in cell wall biosynthesis